MENEENKKKTIELHECQFNYIKDILNEAYKFLSKLPKNRRSPKFYILETLVLNIFSE